MARKGGSTLLRDYMSRTCTVCKHPDIKNINQELIIDNGSLRDIAGHYKLSKTSLSRHKQTHISEALSKAKDVKDHVHGDSLLDRLKEINRETLEILKVAKDGKNYDISLRAIQRIEKQIELQARLIGEISEGQVINVSVMPQWLQIRAVILQAVDELP